MSQYRIVTYNILSSSLADPDYYTSCDAQNLKSEIRLERIFAKLTPEIANKALICLQEVSTLWAGELHRFFLKNNYYFITALYGTKNNGYMGVGFAFPLSEYSLEELKIERIADLRQWPKISIFEVWGRNLLHNITKKLGLKTINRDHPFSYAKSRLNQWIFARLKYRETNQNIVVANYHMPCAFFAPQVMTLHATMVIQRLQKLAENDPFVLAGDFNITPNNPQYQLITTGNLDPNNVAYPHKIEDESWNIKLDFPLRSAYREILGKEPDLTNYSQVKNKETFISTLDYIWLSPQWKVNSVLPLPSRDEAKGPFPNQNEPSDHLLIAADLSL
jgi:2',5'-phosphodiesterase